MLPEPWPMLLAFVRTSVPTAPNIRLAPLLPSVTVPPPVSVTAELPMIKFVLLLVAPRVMPPVPVLFELVMVVPSMVSEFALLKFRTSVLPIVRLSIVAVTFSCTVEADVVMKTSLDEVGKPADQLPGLQVPDPPCQLSLVNSGRANGFKPKACPPQPFPRDHAADGLLAEFAHGLFGSVPQRSLRIKTGQAGTGNQPGKQQPVYIRNAFIVAIMDGHCGTLLCRGREAKANRSEERRVGKECRSR